MTFTLPHIPDISFSISSEVSKLRIVNAPMVHVVYGAQGLNQTKQHNVVPVLLGQDLAKAGLVRCKHLYSRQSINRGFLD